MVTGTSACSSDAPTVERQPGKQLYVALGDSFTAAPYVPETDAANGCIRSSGNYPNLVIEARGDLQLIDVSCGGATSADMEAEQATSSGGTQPPQFDSLTEDASLVTLGIGGNDLSLIHI